MTAAGQAKAAGIAVVDPTHLENGGHHLTSLELLQRALHPHRTTFFIERHSSPQVLDVLDDVRFEFATGQHRLTVQRAKRKANIARWRVSQTVRLLSGKPADVLDGSCYVQDLLRVIDMYGPSDHLILPTARADVLCSLLTAAARRPAAHLPHMHVRLLEFASPPDRELANSGFRGLANFADGFERLKVYTETETLRRHLAERFGFKEIGSAILQPPAAEKRPATDKISIGYLGGRLRRDKGYHRLPDIVGRTERKIAGTAFQDKVWFVVQLQKDDTSSALREELLAVPGVSPDRFRFVDEVVDMEGFSALIAGCDVVILPYETEKNELVIGSGIVIDAVINGVPVVCAPVNGLMEFVSADAGIVAGSDEAFADAIVKIVSDIGTYKAGAARASTQLADAWRTNDLVMNVRCDLDAAQTRLETLE
ncbi:glycosyltransferase [Nitratireductor sp. XY-223]|uniref:glycosyltransferase n=1 Tax=Nitratireductor sp. XY-223 TaxID=2561926 RepID=UPI0010AB2F16|nr:glycosyltransferase [Nitratireductor sp. XY-223]